MGSEKGGESTMYCTEDQNEGGGGRIRERERRSSWELEEELLLYPLGLATVMRPRLHSGDEVHAPFGQTMREEKEEEEGNAVEKRTNECLPSLFLHR